MDVFQHADLILLSEVQIPTELQIHPEIRRHIRNFANRKAVLGVMPVRPLTMSLTR
jgi:hypothetical protein